MINTDEKINSFYSSVLSNYFDTKYETIKPDIINYVWLLLVKKI